MYMYTLPSASVDSVHHFEYKHDTVRLYSAITIEVKTDIRRPIDSGENRDVTTC